MQFQLVFLLIKPTFLSPLTACSSFLEPSCIKLNTIKCIKYSPGFFISILAKSLLKLFTLELLLLVLAFAFRVCFSLTTPHGNRVAFTCLSFLFGIKDEFNDAVDDDFKLEFIIVLNLKSLPSILTLMLLLFLSFPFFLFCIISLEIA